MALKWGWMPDSPTFGLGANPSGLRLGSFALSAGIHAVAVVLLVATHRLGPAAESNQDLNRLARQGRKIIWYSPTTPLPAVAPAEPVRDQAGRAAEFHLLQHIAASAEHPESRRQMVLQSPPQLRLAQDIRSPNVLFFNPAVAPPPAIPAQQPRIPAPRFQMPQRPETKPEPKLLAANAPQIAVLITADDAITRVQPKLPVERPRFVMPQKAAAPKPAERRALTDAAPQVAVQATKDEVVARLQSRAAEEIPGYQPRRFQMTERAAPALEKRPLLASAGAAAPPIAGPQQPAVSAVVAIVGLDPIRPEGAVAPPPGNRSAQFSAGPETGDTGSPALSASAKAEVRVPNLAIAPAAAGPSGPAAGAPVPAASDRASRSAFRQQLLALAAARESGRPGAASLAHAPLADAQLAPAQLAEMQPLPPGMLHGSSVYSLAIDMPNITSYEGSWMLRFSELGGSSPDDILTAPVAMHKVDPKYAAAAEAEGIEGKVLLYAVIRRDGRVDQVRLVQGIDERLDSSAVAAFSKWEFQPATKNGEPVDLEAVVQIPFRAGPRRRN